MKIIHKVTSWDTQGNHTEYACGIEPTDKTYGVEHEQDLKFFSDTFKPCHRCFI